jgi:hypothetical protein
VIWVHLVAGNIPGLAGAYVNRNGISSPWLEAVENQHLVNVQAYLTHLISPREEDKLEPSLLLVAFPILWAQLSCLGMFIWGA